MEKYGVDEGEQQKTGEESKAPQCPDCGAALRDTDQTGVLVCPTCGTKPFEK
jgi:predicted RNA-binding Zn-ribbon protein involved in translation (DUF1610 family)